MWFERNKLEFSFRYTYFYAVNQSDFTVMYVIVFIKSFAADDLGLVADDYVMSALFSNLKRSLWDQEIELWAEENWCPDYKRLIRGIIPNQII